MATQKIDFAGALRLFVLGAQDKIDKHYAKDFPSLTPAKLTVAVGKRYVKMILKSSVYCFVDKTNGDVLKAASWNAPAKHARGNIFNDDNGLGGVTVYGGRYL